MSDQWYCSREGNRIGPVSTEQIREAVGAGKLLPTDLVWKTGMTEWMPANRITGLFPQTPQQNPYAAPTPHVSPPQLPSGASPSPPVSNLQSLQSKIQLLRNLYIVLFIASLVLIVLQVAVLGFKTVPEFAWALTLGGAVACRFYRESLLTKFNQETKNVR